MSFSSRTDGKYDDVSRAYKQNPTLENYLTLRRADAQGEIEVAVFGGIDDLFALEEELGRYGIGAHPLMTGVLDADQEAISELSLKLMEHIERARHQEQEGGTHLIRRGVAMPEPLINYLICVALDAQSWNDTMTLNRDLIVLIRERLGGANQQYRQAVKLHEKRKHAAWIGGQLKAQGEVVSIRKIAEILDIAPSTISRWYPDNTFQEEVDQIATYFDADGKIRLFKSPSD